MSLDNLAQFYHGQGKYTEAKPLYQRVLRFRQALLGAEHPATQAVQCNLVALTMRGRLCRLLQRLGLWK